MAKEFTALHSIKGFMMTTFNYFVWEIIKSRKPESTQKNLMKIGLLKIMGLLCFYWTLFFSHSKQITKIQSTPSTG